MIVEEHLPNSNQTVYHCKEHYDKWDIDLNGLVISHFKPFHTGAVSNNSLSCHRDLSGEAL
jgi:hypothetical protein